jgi:hypothetical protein
MMREKTDNVRHRQVTEVKIEFQTNIKHQHYENGTVSLAPIPEFLNGTSTPLRFESNVFGVWSGKLSSRPME